MSLFRKLTVDEAAEAFANDTTSESQEAQREMAEALEGFDVGDAGTIDMIGTGTTIRAMKVRLTKAVKGLGLRVQYAKEQPEDGLTFRLAEPKRHRSPKVAATK